MLLKNFYKIYNDHNNLYLGFVYKSNSMNQDELNNFCKLISLNNR